MKHEPRDGDCRRCGGRDSWMGANGVVMSGVYQAYLCLDCRNDWDAYITPHPTRLAKTANEDALNMAVARTCGDGVDRTDAMARLREDEQAINAQLRELAVAWVAATITRAER